MSPTAWVDDPKITDETVLWRRIDQSPIRIHDNGSTSISSAAFLTQQMSVHIAHKTDPLTALGKYPGHRLAAFKAGVVRAVGCIVVADPIEDDPSHAIVCRADDHTKRISKGQAKHIASHATLIV